MNELALQNVPPLWHPGEKAVIVRRKMAQVPAIMNALSNPIERAVFMASTAPTIEEISGPELTKELAVVLKFIAKDIGVRTTDVNEWNYALIRTTEILKRYYGNMTLKEFRMAFEMSVTGELDDYLPRDRFGKPDRSHYQSFNIEYVSKILNAYQSRRTKVIERANDAIPRQEVQNRPESDEYYEKLNRRNCVKAFLRYKYTGRMKVNCIGDMLYCDILDDVGLLEPTSSQYPTKHEALEHSFAVMVENEIQILEYIRV